MPIFSEDERNRHNAFINSFHKETDRGAVVIGGVLLDNLLMEMLKAFYTYSTYINGEGVEKEYKHSGFAGTFSARTSLAFALGMISERDKKDIDRVRELRNKFAHNLDYASFDTPDVKQSCLLFAVVKDIDDSGFSEAEGFNTSRLQFLWTISILHGRLINVTKQIERREVPRSRRVEFWLDEDPQPEIVHMQGTFTTFKPDDEVIVISRSETSD